jgi:hypothetical protein
MLRTWVTGEKAIITVAWDDVMITILISSKGSIRKPVATVHQHGRATLAVPHCGISQRKDAERRDKVSVRTGKDTRSGQDP